MQSLTPQNNAATAKNVQSLMAARENAVKVPTTKGTFANTADGWINTSSGGWSANPRRENYSLFSVKWGPATQAFSETGETAASIEGRSHLYMYLGVDRCASRHLRMDDQFLAWNGLHVDGHGVDYVVLADLMENDGGTYSPWTKVITPDMFEVNYEEQSGTSVNQYGTILPVDSAPTPYTGWVETPWTKYSGEPVLGMFWRYHSVPNATTFGGYALVLSRCMAQDNLRFSELVGEMDVDFAGNNGLLGHTTIRLAEPVSEPITIFDEIPTGDISADVSQGIAQGHTGSLTLDRGLTKAPFYAIRSHIFCDEDMHVRLVPGMLVPLQGNMVVELGETKYLSWHGMRFKGNNVYMRGCTMDQQEQAALQAGIFDWDAFAADNPGMVLWANTPVGGRVNPLGCVYLPGMMLQPSEPSGLFTDSKLDFLARVVYHREHAIYFLQFWCPDIDDTEPDVPQDGTPATEWFQWGRLDQPIGYRNMIWRPTDNVIGRFDWTDITEDSWYALSANGAFKSIGRTDDIYGDEGTTHAEAVEVYRFSDLDYTKQTIEADDQYLVRHPDGDGGAVLQYAPLSAFLPNVDTRMPLSVDQNSIDYAETSSDSYLQLFRFPDNQRIDEKTALSDTTDAVLRHRYISAGQQIVEVDYLDVSSVINPIPDRDAEGSQTSSLQRHGTEEKTGREIWDIYKFHDTTYRTTYGAVRDTADILVRDHSAVKYVPLSSLSGGGAGYPPDADVPEAGTSSIETREISSGEKVLQLYEFDEQHSAVEDSFITFQDTDSTHPFTPLGCTDPLFLVRRGDGTPGNEYYLDYTRIHVAQKHEPIDSEYEDMGRSLDRIQNPDSPGGDEQVLELYNFLSGSTVTLDPTDIEPDDGILVRKDESGEKTLEYMTFDSLSNFTPIEKGDSNFDGNEDKSVHTYWYVGNDWAIELYNWRTEGTAAPVTIYGDGCTYRWPQNTKTTTPSNTADYILVKHEDANGNMVLQYRQLEVTMPTLTGYDQEITNIDNRIVVISGAVDVLSSQISGLSGNYWESGGDSSTCYGSDIADSFGNSVIDLDRCELVANWTTHGNHSITGDLSVGGSIHVLGCGVTVGQSFFHDGCLQLGNTTLTESQLQRLLALI